MNRLLVGLLLGTVVTGAIVVVGRAMAGNGAVTQKTVPALVTSATSSPAEPRSSSLPPRSSVDVGATTPKATTPGATIPGATIPGATTPKATTPKATTPDAITAEAIAAAHGADVGIVVFDHQSGQLVLGHNVDMQFTTASLVKLLIAVDLLDQRNGVLDESESTALHTMLSASDDDIADTLWGADGGPEIVTRAAELMGLTSTVPPANPEQWGETTTTASDITMVYSYLLDRAPARYRDLVMQALRNSTPRGADGFNQRFGIPAAVGDRPWAVKQGWTCCTQPSPLPDGVVLHTTGTVGPHDRYIVVVLTDHNVGTTWSTAAQRTTDIVSALLANLPE